VAGDVAGDLAAAGGVAHVHGVAQVEAGREGGGVGGVVVHVVAVGHLGRAAVAATVVGDDAEAPIHEEQHLASHSSELNGQPWWNTIGRPEPQSL
jgi:hypothetical protein